MRKSLLALLLVGWAGFGQAQVPLREGYPQRYTVVAGDTLWSIANRFLRDPWQWPALWQANSSLADPDLIYPGDSLALVRIDGEPHLTLERGASRGTLKLSPQVRRTPLVEAIPTIPLQAIDSFLLSNRILDRADAFDSAPYIVAGDAERVLSGTGDRIFARGRFDPEQSAYGIFRQGKTYTDPQSGELLGINADEIGGGEVVAVEGDIATLQLQRTTQEVRLGDRLFSGEPRTINSTFAPSPPSRAVEGLIIDVPRGVTQIGALDVVTLNKGRRDGLAEGNVLAVLKTGETVRDRVAGGQVKMPDERAGLLMVFRTYDKLSYGLVLNASRSLAIMDKVRNP
ncbi:LysM peptidoglycan-binding domain-containing protein [Pseudomonas chlororaphis]|uniref:LysM peptidoglycan-binding domain-containing protein n=1 Tax=Pseudomonas chlororaphis TaxID=587753 RepID=UPI001B3166FB|nr:LysM domain-containing protein [Pseudomonas chlororaphis]MBP5075747.1 LysM peptidoglycan-binding domain-containing protein [Pseudomonas chlororaphis]QTT85941.1 LysM peptidoglycan-binding domain-containing protein [Pseudomonas chlororaphis]